MSRAGASSATSSTTSQRHPASLARKQQIVDAAVELMDHAGFVGTSVRDIGKAVGLLSGSLYYYFREKEDILYEIQLMLNERIGAIRSKVEDSGLSPLEKIRLMIALHLAMIEDNLALCHVAYTEFRHLKPDVVTEIQGPQRVYNDYLVQLIIQAQKAGQVKRSLEPRTCAGAIFGLLNSVIWWRRSSAHPNLDDLTSAYEQILVYGMASPGRR